MVDKLTTPPKNEDIVPKINEIIDNLGGGGGAVDSVNGQTGTVVLTASDVGALPDTTVIPTATSDLTNDSKFIQNTANISFALGIGGINSPATASGMSSIAIGGGALANTSDTMAIGGGAEARSQGAIQLGYGANYSKSLSVGFYDRSTPANYKLLDGTTGLIPYQRIDSLTDSNAGGQLKYWTGTKAEYDAITTKDANTLYNITDDTDTTALQQLMATKANLNLANCTVPHLVSRTPNNYNGVVEIWSDGYCVQTGCGTFSGATNINEAITINLPQSYSNTNYCVSGIMGNGNNFARSMFIVNKQNTNTIVVQYYDTNGASVPHSAFQYNWRTEGYIQ